MLIMDKKESGEKPKLKEIIKTKELVECTVIEGFKLGTSKPKQLKPNDKIKLTKKAYLNKKREGKVK